MFGELLSAINPTALLANAATSVGTNLINQKIAGENRDRNESNSWDMYQTQRSDENNAVQRRANDMKAAGINPLLAAGDGAGTASGSSPTSTMPEVTAPDILGALNFSETQKNNIVDRKLKNAQARSIEQNTNITTPLESLATGAAKQLQSGKEFIKNWWNNNEKPDFKPKVTPQPKRTHDPNAPWIQKNIQMPTQK